MSQTITITPQWQIYIPQQVRLDMGLDRPGKASIEVRKKKIVITPKESPLLHLAGKYKKYAKYAKDKKVNVDKIRDYIDYANL